MNYTISVIIPALNEESNLDRALQNVVEVFARLKIRGEIVAVNDGSTDRTQAIIEQWMKRLPFIRLVRHDNRMGIGASFWDGVGSSTGEIVTMLPGDAENDAYEILRYLPMMEHVDMVVPFVYNREVRSRTRRVISKLYISLINLSFGTGLNYFNGTVLYRKCIFDGISLKSAGFFYQTELLVKCIRRGYLYAEVPCALRHRSAGRSKALSLKSLLAVGRGYASTLAAVCFTGAEQTSVHPNSATSHRQRILTSEGAKAEDRTCTEEVRS